MQQQLNQLTDTLQPTRQRLLNHPIYATVQNIDDLRELTTWHAFAVWDFMSLLKALQHKLTCVSAPWVPVGSGTTRYLINEIVTGEESDEVPDWLAEFSGQRLSHYELYRLAMKQLGANTTPIDQLVAAVSAGTSVADALAQLDLPAGVRRFVAFTFDVIATSELHRIASVFTFGREDLIPDMFLHLVRDLDTDMSAPVQIFRYYLERHIEVDGDHHSHLAMQMVSELCGDNPVRWQQATESAIGALEARIALWDAISEQLAVPV